MEVVILGHFGLHEQTPTEAAKDQFGEQAQAELDRLTEMFAAHDTGVKTRLVFGKERAITIARVAIEEHCDAELDPAPTNGIELLLVPLVDTANLHRLEDFIRSLCEERTREIPLFHGAEQGESPAASEDPEAVEPSADEVELVAEIGENRARLVAQTSTLSAHVAALPEDAFADLATVP